MAVDFSLELRLSYLRAAQLAEQEQDAKIQTYRNFYEGDQGVMLTARQEEYLTKEVTSFANICKRVVNVPKDRLSIEEEGIAASDKASEPFAQAATDWWIRGNLNGLQKNVYEASLRDTSTAVIVGYDPIANRPTFTPNLLYDGETGLVRFHYDSDDNLIFASKRWTIYNPLSPNQNGRRRLTIYRPEQIERYEADPKTPGGWRFLTPSELGIANPQIWTDVNGLPLGIPVIPFENPPGSELADVVNIQQLLNHNLSTFDVSIDYHGFPLLWFTNMDLPVDSATGKSQMPDFAPAQGVLLRDGGNAGRIEPADLRAMFEAGILSWIQIIAIIKGWPMHVFDRSGTPASGVALQVLEGALVSQIKDKQTVFGEAWRSAFDMGRKLHRVATRQELVGDLHFTWQPAEVNDELTHFEALAKKFEAGQVPIVQRWRELGYTQDQIAQMEADRAGENKEANQRLELQQMAIERERAMNLNENGTNAQPDSSE